VNLNKARRLKMKIDKKKLKKTLTHIKYDIIQRFFNFETLQGFYLALAGILTVYISIYYQQYVIQGLGVAFGAYFIMKGTRETFVNRVKQKIKFQKKVANEIKFGKK
jgi:hypothetical protein